MTSPTDADLTRLRREHNLDLTNIKNLDDLKQALNNTTSRAGSKFGLDRQIEARETLVKEAISWFDLRDVQEVVLQNNLEEINNLETLPDVRDFEIPVDLNFKVESKIEKQLIEKQENLIAESEALADIIRNPRNFEEFENARLELKEIAPQKLGGLKSSEIRSAKKTFRELFK